MVVKKFVNFRRDVAEGWGTTKTQLVYLKNLLTCSAKRSIYQQSLLTQLAGPPSLRHRFLGQAFVIAISFVLIHPAKVLPSAAPVCA
jgi:hypothetical protein